MARGEIITEEKAKKIRELTKQGLNKEEVAKELGVSTFSVYRRTKDIGTCARRLTQEEIKGIRKMRKQGYKQQDIADKFNCSVHAIYSHCKDIKLETKKMVIIKAVKNGVDLQKMAKKNGYDWGYVCAIRDQYCDTTRENATKSSKNQANRVEEIEKQEQLLKEKKELRTKELEELRQQEIQDFRWGGTVKIC